MTANQLIAHLQALSPEHRELEVVHIHTEYSDHEQVIKGYEVDKAIGDVDVREVGERYWWEKNKNLPLRVVLGY